MQNESGLRPVEFNVVVFPDPIENTTKGGIILVDTQKDRDKLAVEEGYLVAASPLAFTYADWPEGAAPPVIGDRVVFARYAGAIHERGGKTFRVLKDKDIVAVVEPQPAAE